VYERINQYFQPRSTRISKEIRYSVDTFAVAFFEPFMGANDEFRLGKIGTSLERGHFLVHLIGSAYKGVLRPPEYRGNRMANTTPGVAAPSSIAI